MSRFRRTMPHAPGDRSTNVASNAPRDRASSPTLPVPQNRSRNRESMTRSAKMLNSAERTKSRIGLIPLSSHSTRRLPRLLPLMIRNFAPLISPIVVPKIWVHQNNVTTYRICSPRDSFNHCNHVACSRSSLTLTVRSATTPQASSRRWPFRCNASEQPQH